MRILLVEDDELVADAIVRGLSLSGFTVDRAPSAEQAAAALASDVLGRELQLSACDIESIARRLIAERCADEPLSVRVCPADAGFACDLPIVADSRLRPGDAVLVCRNGEIDARLAVRFAHVVAAVAP